MDALCWAFICTDAATFAEVVIVFVGVLAVLLDQFDRVIRTVNPAETACSILYPKAGFIFVDRFPSSPSASFVPCRVAGFYDITGDWDFIEFFIHPIFASVIALSIAALFKSPTFPGYRLRTSLITVSIFTTPVAFTAAAIVGIL